MAKARKYDTQEVTWEGNPPKKGYTFHNKYDVKFKVEKVKGNKVTVRPIVKSIKSGTRCKSLESFLNK